jgi:hypothetical protein
VIERPTTNLTAKVYRIADVLAEWRSAERELAELDPESDEAREVQAIIDLLREQHHTLFERARSKNRRPVPSTADLANSGSQTMTRSA